MLRRVDGAYYVQEEGCELISEAKRSEVKRWEEVEEQDKENRSSLQKEGPQR